MQNSIRFCLKSVNSVVKASLIQTRNCSSSQLRRKINSHGIINININYLNQIKILPADLLDNHDNSCFKIRVLNEKDKIVDIGSIKANLKVECDEKSANISDFKSKKHSLVIEVPVTCEININTKQSYISIQDLQTSNISVNGGASGSLELKNIKSEKLYAITENGNIVSKGLILGGSVNLRCGKNGKISLDRMQGDKLNVSTTSGDITVESSYSENSNFSTETGSMELKSIHKNCKIITGPESKALTMTGFYGTLQAQVESQTVNLQLSELVGKSKITSKNSETFQLGLAEVIPTNTKLTIKSNGPINASEIANCQVKEGEGGCQILESDSKESLANSLEIDNQKGTMQVSLKSWIDSLNLKEIKDHQQVEFGLMWNFY